MICEAQSGVVMDAIRSGAFANAFHALQQAVTMAS
jgi:hypothetical protein